MTPTLTPAAATELVMNARREGFPRVRQHDFTYFVGMGDYVHATRVADGVTFAPASFWDEEPSDLWLEV